MPLPASYLRGQIGPRISGGISAGSPADIALSPGLMYRKWPAPLAKVTNGFFPTTAIPSAAITTFFWSRIGAGLGIVFSGGTVAMQNGLQDVPRNVVITITHGTAIVGTPSGLISGVDEFNRPLTEAWTVTTGGTTKTYTGAKSFKRVDFITYVAAVDSSLNSIVAGNGDVLGLPAKSAFGATGAAVKEFMDGAILVTGILVAGVAGSATADPLGTYLPATVPNAARVYEVVFAVTDPTI